MVRTEDGDPEEEEKGGRRVKFYRLQCKKRARLVFTCSSPGSPSGPEIGVHLGNTDVVNATRRGRQIHLSYP